MTLTEVLLAEAPAAAPFAAAALVEAGAGELSVSLAATGTGGGLTPSTT